MNKKVSMFTLSVMALGSVIATNDVLASRSNNSKRVAARRVITATNNSGNIVNRNTSQLVGGAVTNATTSTVNPVVKALCGAGTSLNASGVCVVCDPTQKPDHASWISDSTKPNQCAWECDKNDGYKLNEEDGGNSCVNAKEQREIIVKYSNALSEATGACAGIEERMSSLNLFLIGSQILNVGAVGTAVWGEIQAWQAREELRTDINANRENLSEDQVLALLASDAAPALNEKYKTNLSAADIKNGTKFNSDGVIGGDKSKTGWFIQTVRTSDDGIKDDTGAEIDSSKSVVGADKKVYTRQTGENDTGTSKQYFVDENGRPTGVEYKPSGDTYEITTKIEDVSDGKKAARVYVNDRALENVEYTLTMNKDKYTIVGKNASLDKYVGLGKGARNKFIISAGASGVSTLVTAVSAGSTIANIRDDMKKCNSKVDALKNALNDVATVSGVEVNDLSETYSRGKAIIADCGDFSGGTMDSVRALLTASSITSGVGTVGSVVAAVGANKVANSTKDTAPNHPGEKMALIGGAVAAGTNTSSVVTTTVALVKYWDEYKKAQTCKDAL